MNSLVSFVHHFHFIDLTSHYIDLTSQFNLLFTIAGGISTSSLSEFFNSSILLNDVTIGVAS